MCLLSSSSSSFDGVFWLQNETKFIFAFIKLFHQVEMNAIKRKDVQFSNENDAFCLCMDFQRLEILSLSLSFTIQRVNFKCAQENRLSLQEFITLTVVVFSLFIARSLIHLVGVRYMYARV